MTLLNMIVPDISNNGLLRDKSHTLSLSYSNQEPGIPEFINPEAREVKIQLIHSAERK